LSTPVFQAIIEQKAATKRRVCQDSSVHMWEIENSKRSIIKYPDNSELSTDQSHGSDWPEQGKEMSWGGLCSAVRRWNVKEVLSNNTYFGFVYESLRIFNLFLWILCGVVRTSRHIYIIKTNLMHYLSSVYFINQPLHVSGIFVAHHQEVYCIYTKIGKYCAFQFTVCWPANRQ